nr:Uncharacterised protein [Salmonella sp. NCTC 7297]
MSGDDHALTALHSRQDGVVPVRDNAVDGQRQAFSQRQLFLAQFGITWIVTWITLVIFGQLRRRNSKTATPLFNLFVAIFFCGFRLVQSLQRTIVAFIEFPGFFHWQPRLIQFIQYVPQRMDSAFQYGSVSKIKAETFFF